MWLQDMRIIARQSAEAGALEVLAQRHEVMLMDGQTAWMHLVHVHGTPVMEQRALQRRDGRLQLVSLEHLAPGITADLKTAAARDVPGVVLYTLRARYATLQQLSAAADRLQLGAWHPMEDTGYTWMPSPPLATTHRRAA